jgi:hypothetical protein
MQGAGGDRRRNKQHTKRGEARKMESKAWRVKLEEMHGVCCMGEPGGANEMLPRRRTQVNMSEPRRMSCMVAIDVLHGASEGSKLRAGRW